jgi:hypothetical protein
VKGKLELFKTAVFSLNNENAIKIQIWCAHKANLQLKLIRGNKVYDRIFQYCRTNQVTSDDLHGYIKISARSRKITSQ